MLRSLGLICLVRNPLQKRKLQAVRANYSRCNALPAARQEIVCSNPRSLPVVSLS